MATLEYDPEINVFIRELLLMVFYLNICTCFIAYPNGHYLNGAIIRARGDTFVMVGTLGSLCILILLCILMAFSPCVQNSCCKITFMSLAFIYLNMFHIGATELMGKSHSPVISHVYMANCFVLILYYFLSYNYFDFTSWKVYIWLSVMLLIPLYVGLTLIMHNKIIFIFGTLYNTFTMTLVIQIILGGNAIEIDDEDYALGAFSVYLCTIDVYFKILQRFGCIKGNSD